MIRGTSFLPVFPDLLFLFFLLATDITKEFLQVKKYINDHNAFIASNIPFENREILSFSYGKNDIIGKEELFQNLNAASGNVC